MIDSSSIEMLKNSLDIVDVIGNYLELKKAGANYKCNCPFHGEKTPSFNVSPQKQIYHCFGCGVGGDAIKFVMDYEKLSYPEAIEKLATIYNIPLRYTKGSGDYTQDKHILELMQEFYTSNLNRETNALDYLKRRGIEQSSIEDFGIGYVPDAKEVMRFLNSRTIPLPQAYEAGVLAQGERGEFYARLNNRITFPIYSLAGALVGFGGRTLGTHPAKYINSPQTRLFNKSRLLYGYHRAKDTIYSRKEIIVCEGYLDVILLHQAGFKNAVATLGTALTSEHLPLLKKGEPHIILAYDGDSAGVNAALKASKLLAPHGFEGWVVLFPEGKDPADMVNQGDLNGLKKILRNGTPLIPFIIEQIALAHNLNDPHQKEHAFSEVKSFLTTLSPIMREAYIPKASTILGVSTTLFNRGQDLSRVSKNLSQIKENPAWQSILKTLLENDRLIDEVINFITPQMVGGYQDSFEALIKGNRDYPYLIRLAIDDKVSTLSQEMFKKTLLAQIEYYYQRKLKQLTLDRTIPYNIKSYWIRKIKTDILPKLKKGELVAYESNFPI